jgi:hypothetical protein
MDKLNEFRSRQRASETYRGSGGEVGGNVEDVLMRLGTVESTASDTRAKISEICGTLPTLASKADVAAVNTKMETKLGALDAKLEQKFGFLDAKAEQRSGSLDTKLEQRFGSLDTKLEQRFGSLDAKLEQRFGSLDTKVEQRFGSLDAKLESKFGDLEAKMAKGNAYLTRWIITFGTTAIIGIASLIFTLWKTSSTA